MTTPVAGVARLTLEEWLNERQANAERIAKMKNDADRAGWLEDAAYFAEARRAISDTPTWIACAEQLPKRRYVEEPGFPGISINCLVVDADGDFDVAAYDLEDANWYSLQRATFLSGITHWMPLPEAP